MADTTFIYEPALPKTGSPIIDVIQTIVMALAATVVIYLFLVVPSIVDGRSMEENFHNGDLLFANKIMQMFGNSSLGKRLDYDYKRGDVVIFQKEGRPDYIKRIIAGPGDTIMLGNNEVVVNGQLLDEHYIPKNSKFTTELPASSVAFLRAYVPEVVPPNKYFVMGDNRQNSQDSRYSSIGWIDRSEIKGKVFLRYWPIESFGIINTGTFTETPYTNTTNL